MAEINVHEGYFQHIKVKRLIARLGKGAESLPLRIWCHAATHYPLDGILKNYSSEEIKSICEWNGDASSMLQALLDLNFVLLTEKNCYKINGWEEYQGHIVSYKIRAIAGANGRWGKIKTKINNASSIAKNESSIASSNALTILTKPTILTKKNNTMFIPPTAEEVSAYAKEMGYEGFDANNYINYNERQGWITKPGVKMKNWKADVRYVWSFKMGNANKTKTTVTGKDVIGLR